MSKKSDFTLLFTCEGPLCAAVLAFWALAVPGRERLGLEDREWSHLIALEKKNMPEEFQKAASKDAAAASRQVMYFGLIGSRKSYDSKSD